MGAGLGKKTDMFSIKFDPTEMCENEAMELYAILEAELLLKYSGLKPGEIKAYWVNATPYCRMRTIEVGFPS